MTERDPSEAWRPETCFDCSRLGGPCPAHEAPTHEAACPCPACVNNRIVTERLRSGDTASANVDDVGGSSPQQSPDLKKAGNVAFEDQIAEWKAKCERLQTQVEELDRDACPCLHTDPCSANCTCVDGFSSAGCRRCCSYGSKEQQRAAAEHISAALAGQYESPDRRWARVAELARQILDNTRLPEDRPVGPPGSLREAARLFVEAERDSLPDADTKFNALEDAVIAAVERESPIVEAAIAVLADIRDYCPNPFPSEAKLRRLISDVSPDLDPEDGP